MAPYFGENYYLLLLLFIPIFLHFIFKKLKTSKEIPPFAPGPTPWPLFGNIFQMVGKKPHIALSDLSKIHGPLFMIRLGSTQKMVVASSPAAAKEILKTNDRILSARYVPKSFSNPEELNKSSIGWTETCNEGWKSRRTLCRAELFSVKRLDAQSKIREKKVFEMIEHVKGNKNEVVNVGELVFVTMFNMLTNVLMSNDLINGFDEKNGIKDLFMKMVEKASGPNIAESYPILTRLDLRGIRRYLSNMGAKVHAFYEPILKERRKATAYLNQNDFLDVLLLNDFTDPQILVMMQELLSAGTFTSTSTVEWAMTELIKNPESMKKVIQELDKEIGTNQVKESDLVKLTYLHSCVKETLRLHPPGPLLLPRRAPEACQVMNYTIPKNARIYINIWAMGRDPTIWDEPLVFKPERFLNAGTLDYKGNDFEFVPFGGGRRICPGLPMAGRQVNLILAVLLHSFEWSLPKGIRYEDLDMKEKFGFSLQKEQSLLLVSKPRNMLSEQGSNHASMK